MMRELYGVSDRVVSHAACDNSTRMRYDERPVDRTPIRTEELPATPVRDRNIPAGAWVDAPASLVTLGRDLHGAPEAEYKRRIGPWILWRAGPAKHGHARYWAAHVDDLERSYTFRLRPDGSGAGVGPSGAESNRFRAWKEDLRDHPGPQ
jgi:hypothetical protein